MTEFPTTNAYDITALASGVIVVQGSPRRKRMRMRALQQTLATPHMFEFDRFFERYNCDGTVMHREHADLRQLVLRFLDDDRRCGPVILGDASHTSVARELHNVRCVITDEGAIKPRPNVLPSLVRSQLRALDVSARISNKRVRGSLQQR